MRVLVVHNRYRSAMPSGENRVVDLEVELLREHGVRVELFEANSDDIANRRFGVLRAGIGVPWSYSSYRRLRSFAASWRPDVVHVHNTFPLISPAAIHAADRAGVPVVVTLHNYRVYCAAGTLLRDGKPCTLCLDRRSAIPGLQHRCYRGSVRATLPLTVSIELHRWLNTWTHHVKAYIALTRFQAKQMCDAGLPRERVAIKCHPMRRAPVQIVERPEGQDEWPPAREFVFVGRLSQEKGVHTLAAAWNLLGTSAPSLRIIGDGPLRGWMQAELSRHGGNVRFDGLRDTGHVLAAVSRAWYIIQPSVCYEGFPMTMHEAFSVGTPVIASRLGGPAEVVADGNCGVLFPAGDAAALAEIVSVIRDDPSVRARHSTAAKEYFERWIVAERNVGRLLDIYRDVMAPGGR